MQFLFPMLLLLNVAGTCGREATTDHIAHLVHNLGTTPGLAFECDQTSPTFPERADPFLRLTNCFNLRIIIKTHGKKRPTNTISKSASAAFWVVLSPSLRKCQLGLAHPTSTISKGPLLMRQSLYLRAAISCFFGLGKVRSMSDTVVTIMFHHVSSDIWSHHIFGKTMENPIRV